MKKRKINYIDLFGLIFIIGMIFLPFFNFKYEDIFVKSFYIYFCAYFGFLFLNMKRGKSLFILIPLLVFSLFILFVFKGESLFNNKKILNDLLMVTYKNFPIILFAFIFYLIERISTNVFGRYFTIFLSFISLGGYFMMYFTDFLSKYEKYMDVFLYLFVFLIFSSAFAKANIKKYLYIIASLLIVIEILIVYKSKYFIGFLISPLFLLYLIFKSEKNIDKPFFERYFLFSIIFIYPIINYLFDYFLLIKLLPKTIASLIITFFVSVILHEKKLKFIDYIFLGIH